MVADFKTDFSKLLTEYGAIRSRLMELAWQIAPDDIKTLLCGEKGLFGDHIYRAKKWLIEPNRDLLYKNPTQLILNNDIDTVRNLIGKLIHGVYF